MRSSSSNKFGIHISDLKMFLLSIFLFSIILASYYAVNFDIATNLFAPSLNEAATWEQKNPDLLVDRVFPDPQKAGPGDITKIKIKILNRGEAKAEKFKVKISDESGWGDVLKTSVETGLYKYVEFNLTGSSSHKGRHLFTVTLDSDQQIDELNEGNNQFKFQMDIL